MRETCKKCGSSNLKLKIQGLETDVLKANQVALICGECDTWLKWCPKTERHKYISKNKTDEFREMCKPLTELSQDIHQNAVEHGWWEEERSLGEIVALCHSELSEALEEERGSKPMVYEENGKPEGVAVEMADCIIRILDWCGKNKIDIDTIVKNKHEFNKSRPYKHGNKKF